MQGRRKARGFNKEEGHLGRRGRGNIRRGCVGPGVCNSDEKGGGAGGHEISCVFFYIREST